MQCISSTMAFSTGIGDRGPLKSPREEPSFTSITSPLRGGGVPSQMSSQMASQMASASSDARGQLHRRFTTNNIPTLSTPLSPIGQQRRQAAEPPEVTTAVSAPNLSLISLPWTAITLVEIQNIHCVENLV